MFSCELNLVLRQIHQSDLSFSQAFDSNKSSTPILDPTLAESKSASGFAHLSCIPALGTITNVGLYGVVPVELFDEVSPERSLCFRVETDHVLCFKAINQCFTASGQIHAVAKAALSDTLTEAA